MAVLAPVNLNEKGAEISLLVQDRNGCTQSWQRFLARGHSRHVPQYSTARRKSGRRRNEANCFESEQTAHTYKQGWEAAELAPRVAVRRCLQHRAGVEVLDVRPPTGVAGREELQAMAQVTTHWNASVTVV